MERVLYLKKFLAVVLSCIMIIAFGSFLTGCGGDDANTDSAQGSKSTLSDPEKDVIGEWGGRSDKAEAVFNDDGTCIIGGVAGAYEIKDDRTLRVTPTGGETQEFKWSDESGTSIGTDEWTIEGDKLYVNGVVYTNQGGSSDSGSGSNSNGSSAANNNSSSSASVSGSSNAGSSAAAPSGGESSNNNTSSSGGASSASSSKTASGDETDMPNIVEDLD